MTEPKTRVALVGAGYISEHHLAALRRTPGTEIVGVCDLSRTKAEHLASQAGAQGFTDMDRMMAELRPQTVHVLTPPEAHLNPCRIALEGGASVLLEKPFAISSADCATLEALAKTRGLTVGISHNFLFSTPYQRLLQDLAEGRLGHIDQVDIVWGKFLPQAQFGPFGSWLLRDPRHVLFEVGTHAFAHAVHLVGAPHELDVRASDPVSKSRGKTFYRQWELNGSSGRTHVRVRLSFVDAFTEHYIHLRGTAASATVDFELNTYVLNEHSQDLLDLDRFTISLRGARETLAQASSTLSSFVLSKAGLPLEGEPYQTSITRAVRAFYSGRSSTLDPRLGPELATAAVRLAERAAQGVRFEGSASSTTPSAISAAQSVTAAGASAPPPSVLVLGGSGFIGQALVKRLRREGLGVRALVRDMQGQAQLLADVGAELMRGDFTDTAALEAALPGIRYVFHLARGSGRTWDDYVRFDVDPTRKLARLCLDRGARLLYTSSIAIYDSGDSSEIIREETAPSAAAARVDVYARSKVENERTLSELHQSQGLDAVVFRPGIVIGSGGSPYHWGVGAWPYKSICRLWGDGHNILPFVLNDDCADAMVRAMKGARAGTSFNLVGERCLTGHQYLDELERMTGGKVQRLPLPPWRLFGEDVIKSGLKMIARSPEARRPSYRYYRGLSFRAQFSPEKAKRELGWAPTTERSVLIREGIEIPTTQFMA